MSMPAFKTLLRTAAAVTALCWCSSSLALTFTPTPAEWASWGEMCQARYVVSGAGRKSEFGNRVSAATVSHWQNRVSQAWYGLHHYCAGLVLVRRGKIHSAIKEFKFTFQRVPETHYLHGEIATRIGMAYDKLGDTNASAKYLDLAIAKHPTYDGGFIGKALVLRQDGRVQEAIDVLLQGNESTEQSSAELNYHLGLNYLKLKDYENAKNYADIAYGLGYPLPGLRNRLREAGYWE